MLTIALILLIIVLFLNVNQAPPPLTPTRWACNILLFFALIILIALAFRWIPNSFN
jgi:hypothetical protein